MRRVSNWAGRRAIVLQCARRYLDNARIRLQAQIRNTRISKKMGVPVVSVVFYVLLNPLRAGMVNQLCHWKWIGYWDVSANNESVQYIEFMREGRGLESVWGDKIHPVILGDEAFVKSSISNMLTKPRLRLKKSVDWNVV